MSDLSSEKIHCPFLRPDQYSQAAHAPRNYFAKLSEVVDGADGAPALAIFEAVGTRWFLEASDAEAGPLNDFSRADLALISLPIEVRPAKPGLAPLPESFFLRFFEGVEKVEGTWWEIADVGHGKGTSRAFRRDSLDGEDLPVSYSAINRITGQLAARLESAFGLEDLLPPNQYEWETFFEPLKENRVDHVRVYDVGQGLSQAICDSAGIPLLYLDYGCGVGPNRATRPASLRNFCFTRKPSILLSHWDWDHWAAHLIDAAGLRRTWMAPVQSIGTIQRSFLASLRRAGGTMFRWPHAPGVNAVFGRLEVGQCMGAGRNNSGLAALLAPPVADFDPVLFTGDADYIHHTFGSLGRCHAIIAPHHGGKLSAGSPIPSPSANSNRRLVYSYGHRNTYGHPLGATASAHTAAGWTIPDTRHTKDRPPCGSPGHVEIRWFGTPLRSVPCGGSRCQLAPTQ